MATPPLVSVLMAVHNTERYVAEAIESILAQTYRNFELIVVDDGSTDRSLKILEKYAQQDDRIRLFSRENQGIPKTRNELLSHATGEFVAVMDSDDIALPNKLQRQVEFLQHYPEVVCVGSWHELIDPRGRFLTYLQLPVSDEDIQRDTLAGHGSICHSCAMIRRSILEKLGGYDETFSVAEDLDLWLRLGEVGQLANLPEPLLKYRLHVKSASETEGRLQRQKAREACERAWQRRGIEGTFEATELWRPTQDRRSRHQFMMQYGWWAFNSAQRSTALIYALKAIQAAPEQRTGWVLLVCALIKPLPKPTYSPKP